MNPPNRPSKPHRPTPAKPVKPAKPLELVSISQPAPPRPDHSQLNTPPEPMPIPPPTEPLQYRAIGLIRGRYQPLPDNISKGELIADDGTVIDAIVLGKLISIVKKRLDMSQSYFWVVYPRTQQKTAPLHVQIAGVWAPEAMGKTDQPSDPGVSDGYFSVRGEVVQQSVETNTVVIKIRRINQSKPSKAEAASPAKGTKKKTPYNRFKLKLSGLLPSNAVGYFWDINAQRQGNTLCILDGKAIAPVKKAARKPLRKAQPSAKSSRPILKPRPPQR
jgi:hypothetical protein